MIFYKYIIIIDTGRECFDKTYILINVMNFEKLILLFVVGSKDTVWEAARVELSI